MTQPTDEGPAMARFAYYGIIAPGDEPEVSELSPSDLSSLAQMIQERIEHHEREVKRLECIKKRIKRRIRRNQNGQPNPQSQRDD